MVRVSERLVGPLDLHTHSTHSDGAWTPAELALDAYNQGVRLLALTDHDTVDGQAELASAARRIGMETITGVELTTRMGERNFHILCYDLDPAAPVWQKLAERRREGTQEYFRQLFEQIRQRGIPVRDADVTAPNGRFVAMPLRAALIACGAAADRNEAGRILGSLRLDFPVHLVANSVQELSACLTEADGLLVVAHPAREDPGVSHRMTEDDLANLRDQLPIAGLEAHHPMHPPMDVAYYRDLAERNGLLVTAGSDAHGWHVHRPPLPHEASMCQAFLERLASRVHVKASNLVTSGRGSVSK